jgi:hypothetical protein
MLSFEERTVIFDRGSGKQDGVTYRFPHIESQFSSALLNTRNLELSAGGPWQNLIHQVTSQQKPVGFVDSSRQKEMQEAAETAIKAGCAALHYRYCFSAGDGSPAWFTSAACVGRISKMFDIDFLIADYNAYFLSEPKIAEEIEIELDKIKRFDISTFLEFSKVEANISLASSKEKSVAPEYARCGLLLGYPVWSTASVIGNMLKLPGYKTDHTF